MTANALAETEVRSTLSPEDQDRLAQILDAYLVAAEQGAPLDPEELLAQHPEDAPHLRAYLEGLKLFHRALTTDSCSSRDGVLASPKRPGQRVGPYELVRELGRGGMGVVFEAIELPLKRRVALKVLPAQQHAKQIGRFKNEAQAAAQIQHPHIVPVYAVGVEEGVHFYAMQLIEGQSLAAILDPPIAPPAGFLPPTTLPLNTRTHWGPAKSRDEAERLPRRTPPRHAAVTTLAETRSHVLAMARLGVQAAEALHAAHECGIVHRDVKPSNLLVDDHGKLWVTDFGLARCRETAGLTQTGDILGTLRYMSPEQASGSPALVDRRSDVYSLGVTLYELSTFVHPAQDLADSPLPLDRSRFKPLRHFNSAIAKDFETIVTKAMAELPHERYATAQELADDLERFVEGQPILASPPSLASRLAKWANRRRAAVYAAAAVAVLAVVGLAASLLVINRAYVNETRARQAAERQFRLARDVVDRFGALGDQLTPIPAAASVRRQMYDLSRDYFQRLSADSSDSSLDSDVAVAQSRVAAFSARLDGKGRGLEEYLRAERTLEQLAAEQPDNPEYPRSLALCLNNIGLLLGDTNRPAEAIDRLRRAEALQRRLLQSESDDRELPAELAATLGNLAVMLHRDGDAAAAANRFGDAIALQRQLWDAQPKDEAIARALAGSYNDFASLREQADAASAAALYQQAIDIQLDLVADHPFDQLYQCELARTYNNLGLIRAGQLDPDRAGQCYAKAIELQENLVRASRNAPFYCRELAVSYNNFGAMQSRGGQFVEAESYFRQAIAQAKLSLAGQPQDPRTLSDLGGIYNNLAMALDESARHDQAIAAYGDSLRPLRDALTLAKDGEPLRVLLNRNLVNYARSLAQHDQVAEALETTLERRSLWGNDPQRLYAVAKELLALAATAPADVPAHRDASELLAAAVETLRQAVAAGLAPIELEDAALRQLATRPDFKALVAGTP